MASASVTYVFVNGTAADAIQVNTNFADLVTFLNNQTIHKDGTKAFTANVSQPTTPTAADHLTRKGYVDTESAKLIPKSIVDAAGDLIVASAADTVIRLAKGADGEFLQVQTGSVGWAPAGVVPSPAIIHGDGTISIPVSNKYYIVAGHPPTAATNPSNVTGIIEYAGPFSVTSDVDIDGLAVNCVTQSGTVRLALYESDAAGKPSTLLREAGPTTQGAGTTTLGITTYTLVPGKLYWMGLQTSASAGSTYHSDGSLLFPGGAGWTTLVYSDHKKYTQAQAYGAFPATATPAEVVTNTAPAGVPLIGFQVV